MTVRRSAEFSVLMQQKIENLEKQETYVSSRTTVCKSCSRVCILIQLPSTAAAMKREDGRAIFTVLDLFAFSFPHLLHICVGYFRRWTDWNMGNVCGTCLFSPSNCRFWFRPSDLYLLVSTFQTTHSKSSFYELIHSSLCLFNRVSGRGC